jgi:phenylalanyl-tRNA synthetase beta chain
VRLLASWVRDHLDGGAPPARMAERLTACGMNVEVREPCGDGDELWDVDVTTNRPDAMNHRGLAREAAAAGLGVLKPLAPRVAEGGAAVPELARLEVEDVSACPRYCARVVRGVAVGPSPAWLAARLEACGIRSINNVVDATNFILLDVGQPLHAFDLALLSGREVRVRRARAGERLTTLDGVGRVLEPDDLVIADARRAVALAGIMGGADTEIGPSTRDVLLESAYFDRLRVRRTARRLGLATEASHRFERGADRAMARTAVDACAALVASVAGGEVALGVLDSAPDLPQPARITMSLERLDAFAGTAVPRERTREILAALGLEPCVRDDEVCCTVPPFRVDLELAEDLYEEVLRHFGFEHIPSVLPRTATTAGARLGSWPLTERARRVLGTVGSAEAVTFSFVAPELEEATSASSLAKRGAVVPLVNPLSARASVMRRSVLTGLVEAAAGNLRRGAGEVLLGEVGRVFFLRDGAVMEEERLAVALAGETGAWDERRRTDFYDLKGVVEAVLEGLGLESAAWRPAAGSWLEDGAAAEVVQGDRVIALAGRVGADAARLFDLPAPVWAAEVDLGVVAGSAVPHYTPLPRFPAVVADLTVRHGASLGYARLVEAIRSAGPEWLAEVAPVVRYHGEGVGAGEAKTTVRLTYRSAERSLTQEEVNAAHFAMMDRLARELGVSFT